MLKRLNMGVFEYDIIIILGMHGMLTFDEIKENLEMRQIVLSDKKLSRQLIDCIKNNQIRLDKDNNYKLF